MTTSSAERQDAANEESKEFIERLRRVLGSCTINFLFGAGVNGGSFPQFSAFTKTLEALREHGQPGDIIEQEARLLASQERDEVLDVFCAEFMERAKGIDLNNESIDHLDRLFQEVSAIVAKAENRHPESKRINIFTLNYDRIAETVLERQGQFHYVLNAKHSKSSLPFEIVGYNTAKREYIPTFAIYKLHGSVDTENKLKKEDIVFPGDDKLGNVLNDFYETLFSMKGELLKGNSVLFVIGYSWNDDHVNGVINDALANGLVVYQLQYDESDESSDKIPEKAYVVPPADSENKQDTTLTLAQLFEDANR